MKAPDYLFVRTKNNVLLDTSFVPTDGSITYIRKDALLEWAENELERLYELIPDAHKVEDEIATPMEMRYLGQYMQIESVIDKLNSL